MKTPHLKMKYGEIHIYIYSAHRLQCIGVSPCGNESVIDIILEAAVGCIGNVTCRVVAKRLGRNNRVIRSITDYLCNNSAETIISIPHFG